VQAQPQQVQQQQPQQPASASVQPLGEEDKKDKKYKPKKYEDLVEKSSDDYVVPLELSNKKIYIIALAFLIIVVVSSVAVFYFRAKQPSESAEEVSVETVI
jgi:hypothetical protein